MTENRSTADSDEERAGLITFGDLETGLRREVEVVAERFPDTEVAVVDAVVREVFAELHSDATVEAHLLAITRNEAVHRLEADGHRFHSATVEAEADDEGPPE